VNDDAAAANDLLGGRVDVIRAWGIIVDKQTCLDDPIFITACIE
jgi:hypothetical protein